MKKILINIKNNEIIFSYKTNNSSIDSDLINTNIISDNELIFSDKYILENNKILSSFVKELSLQYNVNQVVISKMELVPLVLSILSKAININSLYIKEDEVLTYLATESIINVKHITKINCASIQPFMLELLDKNNINCETRNEILYVSNFMQTNNLFNYAAIYYKANIKMNLPLDLEDLNDLNDFCKINKYLKTIHVNKFIPSELEKLINYLVTYNRNNLNIVIHENINDEKTINYLKELNKKMKKKYHIYLSLEYSKEYLDKNIFAQTIINMLKVCGLIISSLVILVITYIGVSNYVALKQVDKIKEDIAQTKINTDVTNIVNEKNEENKQNADLNTEEEPKEEIKLVSNMELATLLSINDEVIGELKVNNTNVDYPVVQAKDNDYYLDHNINKEKNANGWFFMDYRNDAMNLNKNNIIYGHNMYYSGVMFGTLHKTTNKSWYTNPDNQIITYNTLYDNMKFRIFSIYRVPKTNDYLRVYFEDGNDFLDFIKKMTERSIYNFNVPIKEDDKIITLSTCSNNGTKRLVIHAVLIDED